MAAAIATSGPDPGGLVPLADKVAFLADPRNHAERLDRIEVIETHMSWVFLGERLVHKLKKPARLPHLDFTSLGARLAACRAELRLNRRLAPEVYEGLSALRLAEGRHLSLDGEGEAVEWLVRMRRLPAALMLDRALREGGPERRGLDRVAARLVRFYATLAPEPVPPERRRAWLLAEIDLSRRVLGDDRYGLDDGRAERVVERLRGFLRDGFELVAERHRDRRIVEGHGDLRPEHVCLLEVPVIIDALEFRRRLRIVDPAEEVARLAVECAMLDAAWAGDHLQRAYETIARDRPPERLLAFHACAHALLRARLLALHSMDPGATTRQVWLDKASAHLEAAAAYALQLG